MTAETIPAYRSSVSAGSRSDGFGRLLRSEWTKLRTVRGWMVGVLLAALVTIGIAELNHGGCGGPNGTACTSPVGPGGEAVTDSFYFVHQPLAADGSITTEITSLTGHSVGSSGSTNPGSQPSSAATSVPLAAWAKAGIIIKASTRPGSAYAAMMVTGGHGVRMQYDYTADIAGQPGAVSAASPRWLRLTRSGDTITGYESADGSRWTKVGIARLAGLPATVQAGLFATTPGSAQTTSSSITGTSSSGGAVLATAIFGQVSLRGGPAGGPWRGENVGAGPGAAPGAGFRPAGGIFTVTGSGDIAPDVPATPDGTGSSIESTLIGAFGGLIAIIVVAAMFMTAEYRRGLLRVTLTATPRRGRVLAAKAIVIGAVTFVVGLVGSAVAVVLGEALLRSNGDYILPVSALTEVRMIGGTAALLAVGAVFALALGALLRSSAAAIAAAIALLVLPFVLANIALPASLADWLLRLTPAAGFAIQQTVPRYAQVTGAYTPANGYFPLAPWAGFAVLCAFAALALGLAVYRLQRRDA
jgi:ABC-type transport system involved in multi-copper enzyme maturation permease subunit